MPLISVKVKQCGELCARSDTYEFSQFAQDAAALTGDAALGRCGRATGLLCAVAPLVAALHQWADINHHAHGPAG